MKISPESRVPSPESGTRALTRQVVRLWTLLIGLWTLDCGLWTSRAALGPPGIFIPSGSGTNSGTQTPWLTDINGAGFALRNANSVQATNLAGTNIFAGKFQQGQGTIASGTGSAAFGLGTISGASYAGSFGIYNQNYGSGALVVGRSNSIGSSGLGSLVSGQQNTASDLNMFISGYQNSGGGSNAFLSGFDLSLDTGTHNSFVAGQHVTLQAGASNNFVWNGDPATPLLIPDTRTNSVTFNTPGGFYVNGVEWTGGGGGSSSNLFYDGATATALAVNANGNGSYLSFYDDQTIGRAKIGRTITGLNAGTQLQLGTGTDVDSMNIGFKQTGMDVELGVAGGTITFNGAATVTSLSAESLAVAGGLVSLVHTSTPAYWGPDGLLGGSNAPLSATVTTNNGTLTAVPLAGDGGRGVTAATFAQILALAPSFIVTNNSTASVRITNTAAANSYTDVSSTGITNVSPNGGVPLVLTNAAAAGTYTYLQSPSNGANSKVFVSASNSVEKIVFDSAGNNTNSGYYNIGGASGARLTYFNNWASSPGVSINDAAGAATVSSLHARSLTLGSSSTDSVGVLFNFNASGPRATLGSSTLVVWNSNTSGSGGTMNSGDIGIGRSAAGVLEVNGGAVGNLAATLKTGSAIFTNSITVTNFIAMPTNYVAANFVPVAGLVKFCSSNGAIFSVTQLSTNLIAGP